ncbi:MAG: hypothetical protein L0Z50_16545 [Verrucomicrobiales bacterium]|nr:hypothetical protein [Verrucomicrobiales bacterium]
MTLVAFVAAEAMCFVHCHFGGGHADAEQPSCHSTASTRSNHDENGPASPAPSAMISCFTLKNLLTSGGALTLVAPDQPIFYILGPVALALDATATEPTASISRAARSRDWVFTPEVSLGPALHSLAPPLLS